jgi:hypothetical protein
MNDQVAIEWAMDMLIQNPSVDADVVYNAAKLALEDKKMYNLLVDYAYYDGNKYKQADIYNNMVEYLEGNSLW